MTINGRQLRERIIDRRGAPLGWRSTSDTVGATTYVLDSLKRKMSTLSPGFFGDAYLRATLIASGTTQSGGNLPTATTLPDTTAAFGILTGYLVASGGQYAVITSNTGTVLTFTAGWFTGTGQAGTTPGANLPYTVTAAYVGKLDRVDGTTGQLVVSPAWGQAFQALTQYEVWGEGIEPDDLDKARDRALLNRCSVWRARPLSVIAAIEDWSTTAYANTAGGVVSATAALQTLDFPDEYFQQSMRVTNTGAAGYIASPSAYVQPGDQLRIPGWVSVVAQTGSIRLRDITNGADIALSTPSTWTGRGYQYVELIGTVPAGCYEVQLWCGGAAANCIADFTGVAIQPTYATEFVLSSKVRARTDVGDVWVRAGSIATAQGSARRDLRQKIVAIREQSAARIRLRFPYGPPAAVYAAFYEEAHYYPALQTSYDTAGQRAIGDNAVTDCPIELLEPATVCELLEGRALSQDLQRMLQQAKLDLNDWHTQLGAEDRQPLQETRRLPQLSRL